MKTIVVYGLAVPQGRPRAVRRGNYIGVYEDKASRNWKQDIKWQAINQGLKNPIDSPIYLQIHFFLPRPKSLPKRIIYHTRKPDLDNLVKAVKDALRGLAYRDDSQIVRMEAWKGYGNPPRVEIAIMEEQVWQKVC